MPPAASPDRPRASDELPVEVAGSWRLPPPHLGNAYRNVFVETAALDVVITMPVDDRAAAAGVFRSTSTSPSKQRLGAHPPPAEAPVVPSQRVAPPATPEPPRGGGGPSSSEAAGGPPVHLSRRSLVVLVALAGLGTTALVVLGSLALFGALLGAGAIDL